MSHDERDSQTACLFSNEAFLVAKSALGPHGPIHHICLCTQKKIRVFMKPELIWVYMVPTSPLSTPRTRLSLGAAGSQSALYGLQHGPMACSMALWPAAWLYGLQHGHIVCSMPYGLQHGPMACSMALWPAAWPYGLQHGHIVYSMALWPAVWSYCLQHGPMACSMALWPVAWPYSAWHRP